MAAPLAVANVGWSGIVASHDGPRSPYDLIPYGALLTLMLAAAAFAVGVAAVAARRYWRATDAGGPQVPPVPYSKFVHVVFRLAALVRDSAERR